MPRREYPVPDASELIAECYRVFAKRLCLWQVELDLDCLRGRDVVSVSPTGSGKSLTFWALLLFNNNGILLIISPLKLIEHQQADELNRLGFPAIAITAETATAKAFEDMSKGVYRVIIAQPESVLDDPRWSKVFGAKPFISRLDRIIVDEAHCVSDWSDFRPAYGRLGVLRYILPGVPVLASSATANAPGVLKDVQAKLHLGKDTIIRLRSNDRPNLYITVRRMKHSKSSFGDLAFLIDADWKTLADVPEERKFLCFAGTRKETEAACKYMRDNVQDDLKDKIVWFHSGMTSEFRKETMERFSRGELLGVVCTDAASMGLDLRAVRLVVQWCVPDDLGILDQRHGRAGRDGLYAIVVLIAEASWFVAKKKPPDKRKRKCSQQPAAIPTAKFRATVTSSGALASQAMEPPFANMQVDPAVALEPTEAATQTAAGSKETNEDFMRELISCGSCRRRVKCRYFGNDLILLELYCCPRCEVRPSEICCDICSPEFFETALPTVRVPQQPRRPNRTKLAAYIKGPTDASLRTALFEWREVTAVADFGPDLPPEAILADEVLERIVVLTHQSALHSLEQLKIETRWAFADDYGEAVLSLVRQHPPAASDAQVQGLPSTQGAVISVRHCSRCHQAGHIRTNRFCPLYQAPPNEKENDPPVLYDAGPREDPATSQGPLRQALLPVHPAPPSHAASDPPSGWQSPQHTGPGWNNLQTDWV